jgi:hypothetical protein
MELLLILIMYGCFIVFQFLPLVRARSIKEISAYAFFMSASFIIIMLELMGINVPSPYKAIESLILKIIT